MKLKKLFNVILSLSLLTTNFNYLPINAEEESIVSVTDSSDFVEEVSKLDSDNRLIVVSDEDLISMALMKDIKMSKQSSHHMWWEDCPNTGKKIKEM